jgi:hypothetical protein
MQINGMIGDENKFVRANTWYSPDTIFGQRKTPQQLPLGCLFFLMRTDCKTRPTRADSVSR